MLFRTCRMQCWHTFVVFLFCGTSIHVSTTSSRSDQCADTFTDPTLTAHNFGKHPIVLGYHSVPKNDKDMFGDMSGEVLHSKNFYEEFVRKNVPVVIRHVAEDWLGVNNVCPFGAHDIQCHSTHDLLR